MSGQAAPPARSGYEHTFPATPACVKEGRDAVVGAIAALGIDERIVDDVRLCVSEAMTNAVRHAYGTGRGTVDVSVSRKGEGAVVVVRDFGAGIVTAGRNGCGGFGFSIIATLTDQYALTSVSGVGTDVSMAFGTRLGAFLR
jgi:anti-sigma regulatory factor (Ser/Thr protein kinase)